MHDRHRPVPAWLAWSVLGVAAWAALAILGISMYASRTPPSAGFDLELLLLGGRRIAQGISPYDAFLLAGGVVEIQSLFFSYPPHVAQATSLLVGIPSWIVVIFVWVGSALATVAVGRAIAQRLAPPVIANRVTLVLAAVAPLWFPYALALLFGNIDAFFPALFGLMLLGVLPLSRANESSRSDIDPPNPSANTGPAARAPGRGDAARAGVALALAATTKLHPASMGVWFLVRGGRDRRSSGRWPDAWRVVVIAGAVAVAVLAASLLVGGLDPWRDYAAVLRAGTNADLLDGRNLSPAVQVVLLVGGDLGLVRAIQVGILVTSVAVTAIAAWSILDPVESLAWATVASFVVLPVAWYHYPAALIPFAVAAVARAETAGGSVRHRTRITASGTLLLGILGVGLPIMWLAVLSLLATIRVSAGQDRSRAVISVAA